MARKIYPYSLDRKDAKIAGVCSTLGGITGVDPTFIRVGFVAAAMKPMRMKVGSTPVIPPRVEQTPAIFASLRSSEYG